MIVQEDMETIFTHPDFLEVVIELLGQKEAPPSEENGVSDEVTERIRRMILMRMRMRHREKETI